MQALQHGIATGATARYNRPMLYRAIRPLARFHTDYRAIDELVMNSKTMEAMSRLSFGSVKKDGTYHTHPAIIDSLTQAPGFTMNCNDSNDLDIEVFMNHGWGSFQIFEPIDFEKEYTTYTCMAEGKDRVWHGDVMIFDGERVVAHFGKFAVNTCHPYLLYMTGATRADCVSQMQGVPRRILKVVLSIESGNKSGKQQRTQERQPTVTAPALSLGGVQNPAPISGQGHASRLEQALSIVAEESGLALSDLTDSTAFVDVGIDSLLAISISARFKDELDIDIDFNELFYECPTVHDLKTFLGEPVASPTNGSGTTSSYASNTPRSSMTGVTTPASNDNSFALKVDFQRALQIISEESGIAMDEFTDDTNFSESGVDSLLSLVITSRFQDELELDIKHEFLLMECPTVADLKQELVGDTRASGTAQPLVENKPELTSAPEVAQSIVKTNALPLRSEGETAELAARKNAVDNYVQKYIAGFSAPVASPSSTAFSDDAKVVLLTGASGSLGSHLVNHIAQLPEVKTVVCLNRKNNADPYIRQQKAMRDKGIHFPEAFKSKLLVIQIDTSSPMLGLSKGQYEGLVTSVTHLIHSAWPMSVKRALAGFESQFQVIRNLIDFACDVVSRRPQGFQFSFQMVSSIGVVGHYGLGNGDKKTIVPEERVEIDSVMPSGYGDAKLGCEKMLDETLHKHPDQFRTMTVRLGQIAGSKTSGYWSPMEHFGRLIKSSQTLNALPNVDGTLYWTPVNDIAGALADLVLSDCTPYPIYHIDNPVGQPWREMNVILADALHIPNLIPFEEWIRRVRAAPERDNPASALVDFLESNYGRMSCGGLVLDTKKTLEHSKTLAAVGPVEEEVVRKYVHIWREIGFLR